MERDCVAIRCALSVLQVRFRAAQLLGGNWEPYPIDMSFQPPCGVLSTIGLAQPGKIQRVRCTYLVAYCTIESAAHRVQAHGNPSAAMFRSALLTGSTAVWVLKHGIE